jgi:arabinose-5-phosphate isomerase
MFNTLSKDKIIQLGQEAIQTELQSLQSLPSYINQDFASTIESVLSSQGRLVITGIGKSAVIAQKIVATLNSTGQPALFMHAADAIHGDLGMIQQNDVVMAISKSGNTPEMVALIPLIQRFGNTFIAMVGNTESHLAKGAHYILNTTIDREACPNNLAPTTSTTAQLLMGDAIAIALLKIRNFSGQDFSKYHPGGALGKKLYLTCGQIASKHPKPSVTKQTPWREVIMNITENRLGVTVVVDHEEIVGIITDGDIRRMLSNFDNLNNITASQIMSPHPVKLNYTAMATEAAEIMQENKISQIVIIENHKYFGVIHIHDLYSEGIL